MAGRFHTHNLFVSHSWAYTRERFLFEKLLDRDPTFYYRNLAVPRDDPVHARGRASLEQEIERRIRLAHVVVVLAGVYATHSEWIQIEMDIARTTYDRPKPILGVVPYGAERTSTVVQKSADRLVRWNGKSIVRAIRELARRRSR